jgi:hypothetical protein
MAHRSWVTSLIRARIAVQKVAGKNEHRTTVFARFGLLDRGYKTQVRNLRRPDTPTRFLNEMAAGALVF